MEFRQQKATLFSPNPAISHLHVKYVPWTYAPGKYSICDALNKQVSWLE